MKSKFTEIQIISIREFKLSTMPQFADITDQILIDLEKGGRLKEDTIADSGLGSYDRRTWSQSQLKLCRGLPWLGNRWLCL